MLAFNEGRVAKVRHYAEELEGALDRAEGQQDDLVTRSEKLAGAASYAAMLQVQIEFAVQMAASAVAAEEANSRITSAQLEVLAARAESKEAAARAAEAEAGHAELGAVLESSKSHDVISSMRRDAKMRQEALETRLRTSQV